MNDDLEPFRLSDTVASIPDRPVDGIAPTEPPKPKTRQVQRFLRGPINLPWLLSAAQLPGKAPLILALALRFEAGLSRSKPGLRLTPKLRAEFGIPDRSAHEALKLLEAAGLVTVERKPGRCLTVSIIDNS